MEDKLILCATANGTITQTGPSDQQQACTKDQSDVNMVETLPVQNGVLKSSIITYGTNTIGEMGKMSSGTQTTELQPLVTEIPNGHENFLKSISMRKRKRDCDSFDHVHRNGLDGMNNPIGLLPSPPTPVSLSMVTVLKFQNGEFVEVPSSAPTYNSTMSLKDIQNAITASLESCISQSNMDIPSNSSPVWSVETQPQQAPSPPKQIPEKIEPQKNTTSAETAKVNKQNSPKQPVMKPKKIKTPDKESIKFANRQKELLKLKREMKKRLKEEGGDPSKLNLHVWGRTVGVVCTMCGKHVQKSYGCFRRDNAPEKLLHLFTPGMNRIKVCRRCLPYKKQQTDGEDPKKGGKKVAGKTPTNDPRKPLQVVKHIVEKPLPDINKHASQEKPVSNATLDAIQRKLTTSTSSSPTGTIFQPSPRIVLGESGKGEAMEYIKKLAENLKANYDKEAIPSEVQVTTSSAQHLPNFVPVTVSAIQTTSNPTLKTVEAGASLMTSTPWSPMVINRVSSPETPLLNIIQANVNPGIKQGTGASLLPTPPWTPSSLLVKQDSSPNIAPSTSADSRSVPPTATTIQNLAKLDSKNVQTIPAAIVVSSQNAVPGQGQVLLQIQRVKLVRERVGESKEVRTKLKLEDDVTGGKNKRVRSFQSPVVCVSCKSSVVKSYRCINKSLSPPKLQHLFSNDKEVLRVCRRCLYKGTGSRHNIAKNKDGGESSGKNTGYEVADGGVERVPEDQSGTNGDQDGAHEDKAGTLVTHNERRNESQCDVVDDAIPGTSNMDNQEITFKRTEDKGDISVLSGVPEDNDTSNTEEAENPSTREGTDESTVKVPNTSTLWDVHGTLSDVRDTSKDVHGSGDVENTGSTKDENESEASLCILGDTGESFKQEGTFRESDADVDETVEALVDNDEQKQKIFLGIPCEERSSGVTCAKPIESEVSNSTFGDEDGKDETEGVHFEKMAGEDIGLSKDNEDRSEGEVEGYSGKTTGAVEELELNVSGTSDLVNQNGSRDGIPVENLNNLNNEDQKTSSLENEAKAAESTETTKTNAQDVTNETSCTDKAAEESVNTTQDLSEPKHETEIQVSENKSNEENKSDSRYKSIRKEDEKQTPKKPKTEQQTGDGVEKEVPAIDLVVEPETKVENEIKKSELKGGGKSESGRRAKTTARKQVENNPESKSNENKSENELKSTGKHAKVPKPIKKVPLVESESQKDDGLKKADSKSGPEVEKEAKGENGMKRNEVKEDRRGDSARKVKTTGGKEDDSNTVKENDKRLRQRRGVGSPKRNPAKNETKAETKCHQTRGTTLKILKEVESETEKEINQGVKRKNEGRQRRGKKAKMEESGNKSSASEEARSGKHETTSTKDAKTSPSKRMKTRKD